MRLTNLTSHPAQDLVLMDRDGDEWLVIMAKITVGLSAGEAVDPAALELCDKHDARGALLVPSDPALERTGTSVLCSGRVMAESAKLRVGTWIRRIRAFGERRWERKATGWEAVPVTPFQPIQARFDHAYGGSCDGESFEENPLGRGFWRSTSSASPTELPLPLVEDESNLLSSPEAVVTPLSLFPVPRSWTPRRERGGTYDEVWQVERAPLLPEDYDPRAQDVAQDEAVVRPFLRGGESFELENLGSLGTVRGTLPRVLLRATYGEHRIHPVLDIVRFEPEERRVILTVRFVCGPLASAPGERAVLRELRMLARRQP